jgi:hypothetical protein
MACYEDSLFFISPSQGFYLHMEQRRQTFRLRAGLETTSLVFERAKTVHVSFRSVGTVGYTLLFTERSPDNSEYGAYQVLSVLV